MSGITSSFAGKPSRKAARMTPSRPKKRANGSRKAVMLLYRELPLTVMFASSQMSAPAGAATIIARPSTNTVRSSTLRTITLPGCGAR